MSAAELASALHAMEYRLSKQLLETKHGLHEVIVGGSEKSSRDGSGGPSIVLLPDDSDAACESCGREFEAFRLAVHARACQRLSARTPPAVVAAAQRANSMRQHAMALLKQLTSQPARQPQQQLFSRSATPLAPAAADRDNRTQSSAPSKRPPVGGAPAPPVAVPPAAMRSAHPESRGASYRHDEYAYAQECDDEAYDCDEAYGDEHEAPYEEEEPPPPPKQQAKAPQRPPQQPKKPPPMEYEEEEPPPPPQAKAPQRPPQQPKKPPPMEYEEEEPPPQAKAPQRPPQKQPKKPPPMEYEEEEPPPPPQAKAPQRPPQQPRKPSPPPKQPSPRADEDEFPPPPAQYPTGDLGEDAFVDEEEMRQQQAQCDICGRNFNADRLERHRAICIKQSTKKRKVFGESAERMKLQEKLAEEHAKELEAKAAKKALWKQQSEKFQNAMKAARAVQNGEAPPVLEPEEDSRVQCPHCGRKFEALVAERHIPKCAQTKAKPNAVGTPMKRQSTSKNLPGIGGPAPPPPPPKKEKAAEATPEKVKEKEPQLNPRQILEAKKAAEKAAEMASPAKKTAKKAPPRKASPLGR